MWLSSHSFIAELLQTGTPWNIRVRIKKRTDKERRCEVCQTSPCPALPRLLPLLTYAPPPHHSVAPISIKGTSWRWYPGQPVMWCNAKRLASAFCCSDALSPHTLLNTPPTLPTPPCPHTLSVFYFHCFSDVAWLSLMPGCRRRFDAPKLHRRGAGIQSYNI